MKKQKICFDTSTISSLFDNSSHFQSLTTLFHFFQKYPAQFLLAASPIFFNEVFNGSQKLIENISTVLHQYHIVALPNSIDAFRLAECYVQKKVLTENHYNDLAHIAYASVFSCDYLVSCDQRHIVRQQTIVNIKTINTQQNIFVPKIVSPLQFLTIQKDIQND
jgi:hypothetical protein